MREFKFKARVYYSDTDCGGIVYHTKYLDFAEHARTEMLREVMPTLSQSELRDGGLIFVVKSITIDYKKPAMLDDELLVTTTLEKGEHFSAIFSQRITRGADEIATLKVKVAAVSFPEKKLTKIPDEVVAALS